MIRISTLFALLIVILSTNAFAQGSTTAAINGLVTDAISGDKLSGATVKLVHIPTGTKYGIKANAAGRYNLIGLKVGGPYSFKVSYIGYDEYVREITKLEIDQNLTLNVKMALSGKTTADVVVTADKSAIINSNKTGASQYVSQDDISNMPTYERSLQDFARLSPSIVSSTTDGSNVGGRNARYNNIQVDGANMNDAFGLYNSGTPGGGAEAQPISLDAIQEFQVSVTPFDVRQGGFTGGAINAITRSGTNNFKGSAYFYGRNNALVSSKPNEYPDFSDLTFGGRVGGPIVKDNLFFFANAEYRDREDPLNLKLTTDINDKNGLLMYMNPDELKRVQQITKEKYGFDPGSYDTYTKQIGDVKLFLRLDYNLTDLHRLTLRHNFVNAHSAKGVDRYSTSFSFDSQEYMFRSMQNQTVLQLNSILDVNMANELKASYTIVNDERDFSSNPFPEVKIFGMGVDSQSTVFLGVERSSQANSLNQKILEVSDNFSLFLNNHAITIGTTNQIISNNNLFIQDYFSSWEFASIDDYINGKPSRMRYTFSKDDNNIQPTSEFSYYQLAFYAQDVWSIMPNLKLTYGLRVDKFSFPDSPIENPTFADDFPGLHTSELPSPTSFSPRVGFNWDVFDDKELQFRGGIGVFAGNTPGVWISNQFSNTGMMFSNVDIRSFDDSTYQLSNWENLRSAVQNAKTQISSIAITDKDFKMPQVLRTSIAGDYHLGYGIIGTIEFTYGKSINDVLYKELNLQYYRNENDNSIIQSKDGRNIYQNPNPTYAGGNPVSKNFYNVIQMTNSSEGNQKMFSVQIQKPLNQGILPNMSFNVAYSTMRATDQNSATASVALSNWQYNLVSDPNNPATVTSNFQVDHRILANVAWAYTWTPGVTTTFGLIYEGRSGSPFSMVYQSLDTKKFQFDRNEKYRDANNDNQKGNDLAYIPNKLTAENKWSDDNMVLANGATVDNTTGKTYGELFEEFVSQFDETERGKINERNNFRQPWRNSLDLKLTQSLALPFLDNKKIELTLDIMNVLNLLNNDWGKVKYLPFSSYQLLYFGGYENPSDPTSRTKAYYLPNAAGNSKDNMWQTYDLSSRWRMQFGMRIFF